MPSNFILPAPKVRLDLLQLVKDGQLSRDEALRLSGLATKGDLRRLFANICLIFGVLLVVAGVLALKPSTELGLALALVTLAGGTTLHARQSQQWWLLGRAGILAGILGLCGWIGLVLPDLASPWPYLGWPLVTLITAVAAIAYRDAFLAALAPIALGCALGGGTAYWHASYAIFAQEPVISGVVFGALAFLLHRAIDRLPSRYELVALIAGRTSFLLLNFGLWVGALWGDHLGDAWWDRELPYEARNALYEQAVFIPAEVFAIGWTALLLLAIAWGVKRQHRFVANTALVFLAINVYTQFHEILIASPWGLVAGGLSLVGLALALVRFNRLPWASVA